MRIRRRHTNEARLHSRMEKFFRKRFCTTRLDNNQIRGIHYDDRSREKVNVKCVFCLSLKDHHFLRAYTFRLTEISEHAGEQTVDVRDKRTMREFRWCNAARFCNFVGKKEIAPRDHLTIVMLMLCVYLQQSATPKLPRKLNQMTSLERSI